MISIVADLLLRNVSPKTLDALKARARERNRSVQAEALELLERSVDTTLGSSLLAWVKTIRDPDVDPNIALRFIREMRAER